MNDGNNNENEEERPDGETDDPLHWWYMDYEWRADLHLAAECRAGRVSVDFLRTHAPRALAMLEEREVGEEFF
jgi:hypothetical protein